MNEHIRNNNIVKSGIGSMMIGLGTYFILMAVWVLVFWFTKVPESWMTYAGGVCLGAGCFTAGIKMGSGMGKRGILTGLAAGIILSLLILAAAVIISGGGVMGELSVIKILAGLLCGAAGGMIGVNK